METRFDHLFIDRAGRSLDGITNDELMSLITPKGVEIASQSALVELLSSGRPLSVKFGIDPTGADMHLGHLVPILTANLFLRAGHNIDFVIGNFTARIGDPSGRAHARVPLTEEQVEQNMLTFKTQTAKFIDVSKVRFWQNASWLSNISLTELLVLFQKISISDLIQRQDFRSRLGASGKGLSLSELMYPVLMGLDSVHLNADIEIGAIDQLLNFMQCRKVMKLHGMAEENLIMVPLIEGISGDGRKMSKSFDNFIAVNDPIEDKFGKIMSMPDRLISPFFKAFADVHQSEVEALERFVTVDPFEAKKQLATTIVGLEAGLDSALAERERFERRFSQRTSLKDDALRLSCKRGDSLLALLAQSGQFESKGSLKRLFEQQAVRIINCSNGHETAQIVSVDFLIEAPESLIRVGKRKLFLIEALS